LSVSKASVPFRLKKGPDARTFAGR